MAKRGNIKTTPPSSADRKPKPKPKPKPAPVENPEDLKLWDAYQRAVANGQERKFLKNHPGFRARSGATMPPKSGLGKINSDDAKTAAVQKAAEKAAARQAAAATQATNLADKSGPFGSVTTEIDPKTGRPVQKTTLTPEQQKILDAQQANSAKGAQVTGKLLDSYSEFKGPEQQDPFKSTAGDVSTFENTAGDVNSFKDTTGKMGNFSNTAGNLGLFKNNAGPVGRMTGVKAVNDFTGGKGAASKSNELTAGYEKFNMTGGEAERARIEDAVFAKLTRNVERDRKQEFDDMEQRMANRGIPLDPSNPAYKKEMDALNEKYDTIKENAMQTATQMGGEELARTFGMGLQSHQQGMSDLTTLENVAEDAYKAKLQGQAQKYDQKSDTFKTNLEAQKQQYDEQLAQRQENRATQEQKFDQSLAVRGENRATNEQNFSHSLDTNEAQRAAQQQQFTQDLATTNAQNDAQQQKFAQEAQGYQINQAGQAQNYGQNLTAHQQKNADMTALENLGTGVQTPTDPGFNAPDYMQTNPSEVWLQKRGQNIQQDVAMAQIEAQKAAAEGGGEEENPLY